MDVNARAGCGTYESSPLLTGCSHSHSVRGFGFTPPSVLFVVGSVLFSAISVKGTNCGRWVVEGSQHVVARSSSLN